MQYNTLSFGLENNGTEAVLGDKILQSIQVVCSLTADWNVYVKFMCNCLVGDHIQTILCDIDIV